MKDDKIKKIPKVFWIYINIRSIQILDVFFAIELIFEKKYINYIKKLDLF